MVRSFLVTIIALLALTGCEDEVGSGAWSNALKEKPKSEWNGQNIVEFTQHCLLKNEIGSKAWCDDLSAKPKGDWTAKEAASYAKHCLF